MRILLVTPLPPSADAPGAIPRILHACVRGLARRHSVTLVTVAGPNRWQLDAADRLIADGVDAHIVVREPSTPFRGWGRRCRFLWCWTVRRLPWRTTWFYEPEVQRVLDRLARERAFDVVAVEDNAMGVYRYPASVPAVLTEHEVRRARPRRWPRPGRGWTRRALAELDWHRWRHYQPRVWRRFDLIQAFTERDAAEIRGALPSRADRVRVSAFGIEVPEMPDPADEQPGRLLFVGNMTHHPNVDAASWLAREILPRMRAVRADVSLTIAGVHPPDEVVALAGSGVTVAGWVPDLRPLVAAAELVLAPVRVGGGMRMKVLEAMALGKAVVTTPRGAEGLAVEGRDPPLAVAADAAGIADVALGLLADPARRRALGAAARRFVIDCHGSDAYARRLEAIYVDAAGRAAARGPGDVTSGASAGRASSRE